MSAAAAAMPVIDCDVHHELVSEEQVYPYLSDGWREYVRGPEPQGRLPLLPSFPNANPHGFDREDAIPPEGGPPGSSLQTMREQLLDPFGIEHAILTSGYGLYVAALPNPHFAVAVARALNDHTVDHWLGADARLKASVALASQTPDRAAEEIRRLAGHPQVVQAMLCANPLGLGFGHPIYDPIHRACAETGLVLTVHSLGDGAAGAAGSPLASGRPNFYFEYHTGAVEGVMTHLMSFIAHGVFERYPSLRLVLDEGGVTWLPSFLRRLDTNYRGLRRELPWLRRLPTEYFHEHVRVTTQPFELESGGDSLLAPLAELGFEEILMFSSDYPHWDTDSVLQNRARLPRAWHDQVFWRNAAELYGLPVGVPA
jgi:predicted TIM-barrel fold metal-dependent hydrolase